MTARPPRICVVGSSNTDLTFRAPRLPRPGETLAGRAFQWGFGGKGSNQAVMAARLGARVAVVSRVGRDAFGERTRDHYRSCGIDTAHVLTDPERPSGVAAIVVDDQAQNCILVVAGANDGLTPQDVRDAAGVIGEADVLLCQLEVPLETTQEALRVARAAGVRTVLNPAPAVPLAEELLRLADLCVPNETEAELLTGEARPEAAGRALLARGPGAVIVTLGAQGALLVGPEGAEHVPAVPVAAVDPTGAGDAFIGSLAVFLAEGEPLPRAARRAAAAAALSVTRLGTQVAFPSRAELDGFLAGRALV